MKVLFQLLVAVCFFSSTIALAQTSRKQTTTTKTVQKKQSPKQQVQPAPVAPAPVETAPVEHEYQEVTPAYDPSNDHYDRNIADLVFVPEKGKVQIAVGLAGSQGDLTVHQFDAKYATQKTTSGSLLVGGRVGIFSGLSAGAVFEMRSTTLKTNYESTLFEDGDAKSSGFNNPDLQAQWRLLSMEGIGLFDMVISAHYRPDLMKAKSATIYDDGTVSAGRPEYGLGLDFYRKWSFIEGAFSVKYDFDGEAEKENATTGRTQRVDEPAITTVAVQVQGMFTENLLGTAGVGYAMTGSSKTTYFDNTTQSTESYKTLLLEAGGKMIFVPNVSMLTATVTFGALTDFAGKATDGSTLDFKDGSTLGGSVAYSHQF